MMSMAERLRRDEGGYVMMVAIVLMTAMAALSALVVMTGGHADRSSGRGRSWAQALHVAEAGAENAIARLQASSASFSGSLAGAVTDGDYCVEVTHQARDRYLIESTGAAPAGTGGTCGAMGAGVGAARRIEVTLAPPASFRYALFSETSIDTKNNDHIVGDVWANQNVTVEQNDLIEGSVTAATGWVLMRQGSRVSGDVVSGGFNAADQDRSIHLEGGARIDGKATAAAAEPASSANCRSDHLNWKVRLDGNGTLPAQIGGNVVSCGPVTGSGTVAGATTTGVYTAAPPARSMPVFTYNAANYDPAVLQEFGTPGLASATAVADFQSYVSANATALSGVFYVNQAAPVSQSTRIDLTGVTIGGDLTIITNTPIYTNGTSDNGGDNIVVLASTYQPPTGSSCDLNQTSSQCSVHIKNNFQVSGDTCTTALLVYAPYGPVAMKNDAAQCGAVYADNIQIKNNQTLIYDARIERVVGFGPVTLEIAGWVEVPA